MEEQTSHIQELVEKVMHYTKSTVELYRLRLVNTLGEVISVLAAKLVLGILISSFFLTFNIGLAILIGDAIENYTLGFFIVSAFYALVTVVVYVFRNIWIKTPLKDAVITQLLK